MRIPRPRKKNRSYKYLLEDMLEAMEAILSYTEGMEPADFMEDKLIQDAVIRNFMIIGEAARNLPDKFRDKYQHVPWRKFHMLRNFLAHQYFGVDLHLVWRILKSHLPQHIEHIKHIIRKEEFR